MPDDVIAMNSRVSLRDLATNELATYTLVFPWDADIANGLLSVLAPVGAALIGSRVGDVLRPGSGGMARPLVVASVKQRRREASVRPPGAS